MTRADHYAAGFSEGCRWAERDLRDGTSTASEVDTIRWNTTQEWRRRKDTRYELDAVVALGQARGYRDTVARFESGALTFEMFEQERESPREPMRGARR